MAVQGRARIRAHKGRGKTPHKGGSPQQPAHQRGGRGGKPQPERQWWSPPKTEGEAKHQAYRETLPEYLPILREKQREIGASKRRVGEVGNWWNEYLKTVQGAADATQQGYANAAQQTQGLIGQAAALDSQNTARLNQEAAASAAARGVEAPTAAFTARASAAQAQRSYLGDVQGSATAARGANQFAYLQDQKRIGAGQRVKSMIDEGARTRKLHEDVLAAKKEQGAQAVKNLQQNREAARDFKLKLRAFTDEKPYEEALREQSQLGYKGDTAAARAQEKAAELYSNAQHDTADATRESAHTYAKGGGKKQKHKRHEEKHDAWVAAMSLYEVKEWPSWAALETKLRKEGEVSPADAAWAVRKLKHRVTREEREAIPDFAKPHTGQ